MSEYTYDAEFGGNGDAKALADRIRERVQATADAKAKAEPETHEQAERARMRAEAKQADDRWRKSLATYRSREVARQTQSVGYLSKRAIARRRAR